MNKRLSNLPKIVFGRISKCMMYDISEQYADDIDTYRL